MESGFGKDVGGVTLSLVEVTELLRDKGVVGLGNLLRVLCDTYQNEHFADNIMCVEVKDQKTLSNVKSWKRSFLKYPYIHTNPSLNTVHLRDLKETS